MTRINGEAIYQIFLRAFTPEGTIAAAEKLLPEVADLGVKILYLCPVAMADRDMDQAYWSPRQVKSGCNNPCNPYRIADYMQVDPEYGTEEDLKSFIRAAHRLGLKVLLDLVYYHAGPTFVKAHPDFAKGLGEVYRFPELDFSNPEVRSYLLKNMQYYAFDLDADGFRCDVGDKVPFDFWKMSTETLRRSKPDLIMLCEGIPQSEDETEQGVFDIYYNWNWCQIRHQALLTREVTVDKIADFMLTPYPCVHYFENHDFANDSYEERIEKVVGSEGVEALLFLDFMLDGVPFLYNGVEERDSARHSIFANPGQFSIDRNNDAAERRRLIKELTALRLQTPALYQGGTACTTVKDGVLQFVRNDAIFCTVNFGCTPFKLNLPDGAEWIVKSKNATPAKEGFVLPEFGFAAYTTEKIQKKQI